VTLDSSSPNGAALNGGDSPEGPASPLSRRDALKLIGVIPTMAALGFTAPQLERAGRALAVVEATGSTAAAPKFFTSYEWRTLRILVDYIIPADGRSGSATDAKVPEYIDFLFADPDTTEGNRVAIRGGLAWLDGESRKRFGKTFALSSDMQRRQILDDIAFPKKAPAALSHGVAFFNRIRDLTAGGFFSSKIGWEDLQYEGNKFVPVWDGCPPEANAKLGVSQDLMKTRVDPH
jgi:gluconate 2-dehydrogenase gamma chain